MNIPKAFRYIFMLTLACLLSQAYATTVFFEDFKTGGDLGDRLFTQSTGNVTVTTGTETVQVDINGFDAGGVWGSYSIEYPGSGSITWDTTQNQYVQAWIPYNSDSDLPALFVNVDNAGWSNTWWDIGNLGGDGSANQRPGVLDLNTLAGLAPGVHQLRFRLVFGNTPYAWQAADTDTCSMTWDWFKGGMAPGSNLTVGTGECGFVGPTDNSSTTASPTLAWTAPTGFTAGTYSVSYSKDRFFRGPTTVTVHNIATTSYTLPANMTPGRWYWTVMGVNSDDITGRCLPKGIGHEISNGDWRAPYDYEFYSVNITGEQINGVHNWEQFE